MTLPPADRNRPPLLHISGHLRSAGPVLGFVVLLGALFALSYMVGGLTGPVAPGMRPAGSGEKRTGPAESGEMGGMHGMGAPAPGPVRLGGR